MFHAKSYETLSRFVQLMQKKNRGLFFSGHVLYNVLFYGEPVKRVRVKTVPVKTVRKKRVQVKTVLGKNGPGKKGPSDYLDSR